MAVASLPLMANTLASALLDRAGLARRIREFFMYLIYRRTGHLNPPFSFFLFALPTAGPAAYEVEREREALIPEGARTLISEVNGGLRP